MRISVIIAVYNTERYLPECLESLLRQSHQDWEAWCVDDGSTDGSLEVLKRYAQSDDRFKVVKMKENGGQGKARNYAISRCEGDIVVFLDSDDWLSDDGLEQINSTFTTYPYTGCVLWNCRYVYSNREEEYPMAAFTVMSGKEAFQKSLKWDIHGVYAVTAELHKRHLYDTTTKWYSDDNTTRIHYLMSKEVRTCEGRYYYRQHEASVTHAISIHHFDILEANISMRKQLHEVDASNETLNDYESIRWHNIVDCYLYMYIYRNSFNASELKEIRERIKRAFRETDFKRIPRSTQWKFGYSTMFSNWTLFRMQEELYFSLRALMRKNSIGR